MTQDSTQKRDLAARLIDEDGGRPATDAGRSGSIDLLVDQEVQFERRVRRVAMLAWSVTFATLPILGIMMFMVDKGGGKIVEVARWIIPVVGAAGVLSFVGALLTTLSWLFRSRAASLAAIDRRLTSLEELLRTR